MKWYWVITSSNAVENPLVTDSDNFDGRESEFVLGKPFQESPSSLTLIASETGNDGMPDDALQNHLALPILSGSLQHAMTAVAVRGAELVPVELFRPDRTRIDGYAILNVLHRRDALNRSKSDFDLFPDDYVLPQRRGMVRAIRRPVLDARSILDTDFLRLNEYPFQLFVSDRVRGIFEKGRFTGWSFREVEVA